MKKIVLTFGLIAGAILSAMMLITIPFQDEIGLDHSLIIGYTTMVLAFMMIFAGVKSYRDNVSDGTVSFGRAFVIGLLITVVASVCYVATWEVYYHKVAPDYLDKYTEYALAKERESGATDAQILEKAKEMKEFNETYKNNPLVSIGYTFLEPLPVGIVLSLIAAGVMSRKRRNGSPSTSAVAASL